MVAKEYWAPGVPNICDHKLSRRDAGKSRFDEIHNVNQYCPHKGTLGAMAGIRYSVSYRMILRVPAIWKTWLFYFSDKSKILAGKDA